MLKGNMMKKLVNCLLMMLIAVSFMLQSCFKEEFNPDKLSKNFELNPDFIIPIGHGSLSIADIVKQNDTIRFNGDSIELYIRKDTILTLGGEDFFNFPDQTTKDLRFDLGNRQATNETVTKSVPLGVFGPAVFPTTFAGMTETTAVFPVANDEQPTVSIPLDSMLTYDWIDVSSGNLEMNVRNNFPVQINSLEINLRNVDDDAVVGNFAFTNIPSGSAQTRIANLVGKTVQNELYAEIADFYTPGSSPSSVPVNFSDDLEFTIVTVDLRVNRGRAILPDQVFDSDTSSIQMDLENGEELTTLHLATGMVNYELYSYVEEDVAMSIELPNTTRNGAVVTKYTLINALGSGPTFDNIDLTNSITQLENNGIPAIYTTSLVSSNRMVEFDFTDTVNYNSTVEKVNITVASAVGYFGTDTIQVPSESFQNELNLFSKFDGEFELTNPQINILYTNSYGIPLDLNLDFIGEYFDGDNVDIGTPAVSFNHPSNVNDDPYVGVINFNKNNLPGIVNFLKFPPADVIHYSGLAVSNPGGKTATPNFINNISEITVGLELKLPLELRATDVVLQDTLVFDGFNNNGNEETTPEEKNTEISIREATLAYKIKNGFPLDLDFQIVLYDSITDTKYDTVDVGFMAAAPVDNRGIVIAGEVEERRGALTIDDNFVDNLTDYTNKIIIVGKLNTTKDGSGNAQSVKILTSYNVEFNAGLIAKMSIKTNFNKE